MRPQEGAKSTKRFKSFSCALCAFLCLFSFVSFAQETQIQKQQQRLGSSDMEERRDAIMRLGSMRLAAASRAALPGLKDDSPIVRATAAKAILSLSAEESVPYLLPLLNDKEEFVRREAAYALGLTHSRSATSALSERLLNDKEDGVRGAAAIALGHIADEAAVVPLVTTLEQKRKKPNAFVLRAAASALGQIKSRAGTAALISVLGNEKFDSDVRREAARSLGLIGDPSAAAALKAATTSEDPYLSRIAHEALQKLSSG